MQVGCFESRKTLTGVGELWSFPGLGNPIRHRESIR